MGIRNHSHLLNIINGPIIRRVLRLLLKLRQVLLGVGYIRPDMVQVKQRETA